MRKLSQPQFDALRYAKGRQLFARDINEGDGNLRRSLLWLLKHDLLAWDPIYQGRVVLTKLGEQRLDEERAARRPRARRADPPGTLRIRDIDDRRVITLTGVHEEEQS